MFGPQGGEWGDSSPESREGEEIGTRLEEPQESLNVIQGFLNRASVGSRTK